MLPKRLICNTYVDTFLLERNSRLCYKMAFGSSFNHFVAFLPEDFYVMSQNALLSNAKRRRKRATYPM